jgi:hypothetical protein
MDANQANGLLDLLELEAANFARAIGQAGQADTASALISWQSAAIESAFGAVEIAGRLRSTIPTPPTICRTDGETRLPTCVCVATQDGRGETC